MKVTIETKFDVGQKVFWVERTYGSTTTKCSHCNGQYREIVNGIEYLCPHCKGGMETIHENNYHLKSGIVTNIRFTFNADVDDDTYFEGKVDSHYRYDVTEHRQSYFSDSDGNSRTLYEGELYATKDELIANHPDKFPPKKSQ